MTGLKTKLIDLIAGVKGVQCYTDDYGRGFVIVGGTKADEEVKYCFNTAGAIVYVGINDLCCPTQSADIDRLERELTLVRAEMLSQAKTCEWEVANDGHFNTSCANATRVGDNTFKYCPYCGGAIAFKE